LSVVDLGVVQLQPDADVLKVQQTLRAMLPNDVAVYTKHEMMEHERRFWHASTPVGFIFALGTLMGFVVGVVICYQVLYASIADHVDQFATLRAMGYPSRYFIGVVLCEAVYLSLLGFVPGLLLAMGAFYALGEYTGLLLVLTLPRAAFVYLLALVMCTLSGCLAMRKVLAVDPAELF
jgi:putative ABC transport system permease protein